MSFADPAERSGPGDLPGPAERTDQRALSNLLCQSRDPASIVSLRWDAAVNTDRAMSWGEFVIDVARLRDRIAASPPGGWVLVTEDAYCFAVGLFALWHAGRHAISPPNRQSGSLRSQQARAVGVLSDRPDWFSEDTPLHPLLPEAERRSGFDRTYRAAARSFASIDEDLLAVEFFTSGTTGDEKPVPKALRHLASEVAELGHLWNDRVRDGVVFSSASHQHLYGMLFGVLWPLAAGHVFQAEHFLHAGELVPRLIAARRSVLASVPTHLKRLAQHARSPELRAHHCEVFSSGGPLPEETAHRIAALVGRAPIEVYGSTETGGIAWRRQEPPRESARPRTTLSPAWAPFPSVEVDDDPESGTLRVHSPFVSAGGVAARRSTGGQEARRGVESFTTGDRASMREGGGFELRGRADRVVKIGERRLDLARMESDLRGVAWIDEIALTTLRRDAHDDEDDRTELQERVAAVVVPSEKGWSSIRTSGRRDFIRRLRRALSVAWDPVLHPRYWRLVLELPENPQGKTTQPLLRALFREADWGRLGEDRPELLSESRSENRLVRTALVPPDLSCFPGHFPDRSVVPGVLQLDWALAVAEILLGYPPRVVGIDSLKWLMPLDPGQRVRICVEHVASHRIDIRLSFGDQLFAKGRIRIAGPEA